MLIYVPFTELSVATRVALIGYDYESVRLDGEFGYSEFFAERWSEELPFVNVEHDCVPWPGAIDALIACSEPWCAFSYSLPCHRSVPLTDWAPLGCAKIGAPLIGATRGTWDQSVPWGECDVHLAREAVNAGFRPHQHSPGVVNANPALLS